MHFDHKWTRSLRPVALGQTRAGFLAAALLLAVWQMASTAQAQAFQNPGHSQNSFFRVDWDYDLANGVGLIDVTRTSFPGVPTIFILDQLDFLTFGREFDSIHVRDNRNQFRVDPIGDDFLYSPDEYLSFADEMTIDVSFPSEGIALDATDLDYAGEGYYMHSSSLFRFIIPPSSMNFVSIRAIVPEPSGAASLLLGSIVAGAVARRRS